VLDASFNSYSKGFAESLAANADPGELKKFARDFSRMIANAEKIPASNKAVKKRSARKSIAIPVRGRDNRVDESLQGLSKVTSAKELISRSFVVTLVSQFDAYFANLVRALYQIRPDILNLYAKTISYSELVELGDAGAVEHRLIDGEIESLLRSSHNDQFKWLETKFEIRLREADATWEKFIELTERRNLFVHANARVTSQYLRVCKNNKVSLPETCCLGARLPAPKEYIEASYSLLAEIGVKLGIILWKKAAPQEQSQADAHLSAVTLNLIKSEKYALAKTILESFLFSIPAGNRTESISRTMVINLAQCLKRLGQEQDCRDLVKRFDWSATSPLYNLCIAVPNDDFAASKKLMRIALHAEAINKRDVETWPLFREFRKSREYEELQMEMAQDINQPLKEPGSPA
jgi:hypothetical protein